jgi:hypothetical protein
MKPEGLPRNGFDRPLPPRHRGSAGPTRRQSRRVALNLGLAILSGVAISAWVLSYTDFFPQVATLLGLGGLFAWIAFISQVVTAETKVQIQRAIEVHVLSQPSFGVIVAVMLGLFGVWAAHRGSLVVSTLHDTRDRTVEIRALDSNGQWSRVMVEDQQLPARSRLQWSLPAPFSGSLTYRVKVSGLPTEIFPVTARGHRRVNVPFSFSFSDHPALLLHAKAILAVEAERQLATLVVRAAGGRELGSVPFRGQSVWVGCDADVEIPESILARWRVDLGPDPTRPVQWLATSSVAPDLILTNAPKIWPLSIELSLPPLPSIRRDVFLKPPYPQEVILDVPHRPT